MTSVLLMLFGITGFSTTRPGPRPGPGDRDGHGTPPAAFRTSGGEVDFLVVSEYERPRASTLDHRSG
jgi:hypothetical protein